MISMFDEQTRDLIDGFRPRWTALRTEGRHFSGLKDNSFTCASVIFVGQPSLLCGIDSKDFPNSLWEYFHIRCDIVDERLYASKDVTLASKGGSGELDRKLQWLFETPTLALTEGVEEFWDSIKPDAKHYEFSFYNGLLISDPKGRGSLRLTASDMPDFILTGKFNFGPEAA